MLFRKLNIEHNNWFFFYETICIKMLIKHLRTKPENFLRTFYNFFFVKVSLRLLLLARFWSLMLRKLLPWQHTAEV